MRLGFAVKVLGRPNIRSHDSRRWQNNPHLSVSLAYLRDLFLYLNSQNIRMYRLSTELAPYLTHPTFTQFHHQIEECETELAATGAMAQQLDIRLSFHAGAHVILNVPDDARLQRSIRELNGLARLLDAMQVGRDAVIVIHVGGYYHNKERACASFVYGFEQLSESTRKRLVLEHDDRRFCVRDCLWIHQETGIPLVFDLLHHQLFDPTHIPVAQALAGCLATWPPDRVPKIHISTPATEMVRDRQGQPHPPRLNRHSHYVNPFPVIDFLSSIHHTRDFDIMLEAKASDLALQQFRKHLLTFAPDLAGRLNTV